MKHTSQGRVVCGTHWTLRNARLGCYSARALTRRRSMHETVVGSPTRPPSESTETRVEKTLIWSDENST
eukprot:1551624-Prymnesium_polylepis.1